MTNKKNLLNPLTVILSIWVVTACSIMLIDALKFEERLLIVFLPFAIPILFFMGASTSNLAFDLFFLICGFLVSIGIPVCVYKSIMSKSEKSKGLAEIVGVILIIPWFLISAVALFLSGMR